MKKAGILILFACLSGTHRISAAESPSIGGFPVFPPDNPWNWDISTYAVHPNSDRFIQSIGAETTLHPDFGTVWEGAPIGIPYNVVGADQPLAAIRYTAYGDESDPGPFPVPQDAFIEGGPESDGDRHVIVVDTANAMLYELYHAFPAGDRWEADSGAKFDLSSNALRPEEWTSADAAGLPIFPGLARYEEVLIRKRIDHALRFTVSRTRREYIWPARHFASEETDPDLPAMGQRFRLKAGFDVSGFSEPVRVILAALKKYGMIVADNGSDWFIGGAPDDRWDDEVLGELKTVAGSNFEAVLTVDGDGNPIYPPSTSIAREAGEMLPAMIGNYPNPFNPSTTIRFFLPAACAVRLEVFEADGRVVAGREWNRMNRGSHEWEWRPELRPGGVYLYRLVAGGDIRTGKKLYLK
jgi:hypothetical protein